MNDRELLEMAAKAAGIKYTVKNGVLVSHGDHVSPPMPWNPLDDDGDAMRLAVKLRLDIVISDDLKHTVARKGFLQMCVEAWGDDENTATRRAIVRVAARIGRAMD